MKLRKQICALLFAALLFLSAGASGETADPDYYRIGLKVTGLMGEMTDSDAYFSLMSAPDAFRTAREAANTHDYDRPVVLYSISLTDPEAFLEKMLLDAADHPADPVRQRQRPRGNRKHRTGQPRHSRPHGRNPDPGEIPLLSVFL